MRTELRGGLDAWVSLGAGLSWFWLGALSFLLALLPGVLLVYSGGARLLWREDTRILRVVALAAVVGCVLSVGNAASARSRRKRTGSGLNAHELVGLDPAAEEGRDPRAGLGALRQTRPFSRQRGGRRRLLTSEYNGTLSR